MATDAHEQSGVEIINCVECGKVLNDPKNRGDPDVDGEWVCADATCRALHDTDMTSGPGADE